MPWFFLRASCFKREMKFRIRMLLYLFDCGSFRQDHGKSKFTIYIFLYNVRILYEELKNVRVASYLTRKNAVIPKLGHKLGAVQYLSACKRGAFNWVNSCRGNSKRLKSCVWMFFPISIETTQYQQWKLFCSRLSSTK